MMVGYLFVTSDFGKKDATLEFSNKNVGESLMYILIYAGFSRMHLH